MADVNSSYYAITISISSSMVILRTNTINTTTKQAYF